MISCLMVTQEGRFDLFKQSVSSFLKQTYPDKELIIVNESAIEYQDLLMDHVKSYNNIHFVSLQNQPYTLGDLRNISVGAANGDIVVQWDDDDFCAPNRLILQYELMLQKGAIITFLTDQLHFYVSKKELYWDNWFIEGDCRLRKNAIPGTMMAYKEEVPFYPSLAKGEDTVLVKELEHKHYGTRNIALLDGIGYIHVYLYHGKNVHDEEHHSFVSRRAFRKKRVLGYEKNIRETLDILGFGNTKVMGRDGLAFQYLKKDS